MFLSFFINPPERPGQWHRLVFQLPWYPFGYSRVFLFLDYHHLHHTLAKYPKLEGTFLRKTFFFPHKPPQDLPPKSNDNYTLSHNGPDSSKVEKISSNVNEIDKRKEEGQREIKFEGGVYTTFRNRACDKVISRAWSVMGSSSSREVMMGGFEHGLLALIFRCRRRAIKNQASLSHLPFNAVESRRTRPGDCMSRKGGKNLAWGFGTSFS